MKPDSRIWFVYYQLIPSDNYPEEFKFTVHRLNATWETFYTKSFALCEWFLDWLNHNNQGVFVFPLSTYFALNPKYERVR